MSMAPALPLRNECFVQPTVVISGRVYLMVGVRTCVHPEDEGLVYKKQKTDARTKPAVVYMA